MIGHLSERVGQRIEEAKQGSFGLGGYDLLDALVLLNVWHPEVANWSMVEASLALPNAHGEHVEGAIHRQGQVAEQLPAELKEQLRPHLDRIAHRVPPDMPDLFAARGDAESAAMVAMARLFPDEVGDTQIRQLASSSEPSRRIAAIDIITTRKTASQLNLVALLAHDADINVRAAAAEGLAWWAVEGVALPDSLDVLKELVDNASVSLAIRISAALLEPEGKLSSAQLLVELLGSHPSATVRARVLAAGLTNGPSA